jgi:hypothetical protein
VLRWGFEQQLQPELAALTGHKDSDVELCGLLPPGRLIETDEGKGRPGLWMTVEQASADLWTAVRELHGRTGLWPLLLESSPHDDEFRPWESGELSPEKSPGLVSAATSRNDQRRGRSRARHVLGAMST